MGSDSCRPNSADRYATGRTRRGAAWVEAQVTAFGDMYARNSRWARSTRARRTASRDSSLRRSGDRSFTTRSALCLRRPKHVGVQVTEQLDDGRIPRPPQVHRQFAQLTLESFFRGHASRHFNTDAGPRRILPPLLYGHTGTPTGAGDGRRPRSPPLPPDPRPRQARRAVRRPLPDHRLRPVEPGELGHPGDLRAHPVQGPVAGGARAAHLELAQQLLGLRDRGARPDAHGRVLVPGHRRLGLPELPDGRGLPARRRPGVRRRPRLQDERPPDGGPPSCARTRWPPWPASPSRWRRPAAFGIVQVDTEGRIVGFQEKPDKRSADHPRRPDPLPGLDGQLRLRARAAGRSS